MVKNRNNILTLGQSGKFGDMVFQLYPLAETMEEKNQITKCWRLPDRYLRFLTSAQSGYNRTDQRNRHIRLLNHH